MIFSIFSFKEIMFFTENPVKITDTAIINYLDYFRLNNALKACIFNEKVNHSFQGFGFSRYDNLDTNLVYFNSTISWRGIGNCCGEIIGSCNTACLQDMLKLPNGVQICKNAFGKDFSKPIEDRLRLVFKGQNWFSEIW